jgi:hypothetical protein
MCRGKISMKFGHLTSDFYSSNEKKKDRCSDWDCLNPKRSDTNLCEKHAALKARNEGRYK